MSVQQPLKLTGRNPKPIDITLNDFKGGINTLLDESRTPLNAARASTNMMQKQDGLWAQRWGTQDYGPTYTGPIDGVGTATKANADGTFTQYLLRVNNGVLERIQDGGAAVAIGRDPGVPAYTAGYHCDMKQIASRVYICNGTNKLTFYDIATDTIKGFTALGVPAAPTIARSASLAAGSFFVWYRVSAVNTVGETPAGTANASFTVNKTRDNFLNNGTVNDYLDITFNRVTNAVRYNIYYSDSLGYEVYLASIGDPGSGTTVTYRDDGSAAINDIVAAPVGDTTDGPIFSRMALSGNRLWGTGDPSNPWRVYWSGTGQYQGAFSPFYGGGYIDLEKGGGERPTQVKSYRDGKGDPKATVFTTSPDGTGSEWQIALSTTTIGSISYITPSAYKVVGSVGTNSPDGIIEARNNLYFPSTRGFFTLGAKPNLINVLSTDEISLNIRPSVNNINNAQSGKIAGFYFDGKLFWSVPVGSTDNNEIWILDLERNSWARPWTVPVKQFVTYTSSDGVVHLLAVPVTGTKMFEFAERFKGDNGLPFPTSYRSGLIHFDKNHREFAKVRYVYIELARPQGTISFSVSGTKKNKLFSSIGSITISDTTSGSGFSSELFSQMLYGDPYDVPTTFSQSSVKKRLKVNKLLNNVQLEVNSNSSNTDFTINQFMLTAIPSETSDPASWKS